MKQQRIVTTYLHDKTTYCATTGPQLSRHIKDEELFKDYLDDGWRVVSMVPLGAGVGSGTEQGWGYLAGWLVVLLEKD